MNVRVSQLVDVFAETKFPITYLMFPIPFTRN